MPNLETNNQTDTDLTVVKSNDVNTSLSLSEEGNGAKVDGDLIITKDLHVQGNIKGISDSNYPVSADTVTANNLESLSGGDLTLKSTSGDLVVDVGGLDLKLGASGTSYIEMNVIGGLKMYDISDTPNDYAQLKTETHGQLKIVTEDASGNNLGDLVCDIEGAIVLDSNNGEFNMRNAGVNFSPANSSYAGMILACTEVYPGSDLSDTLFFAPTSSYTNVMKNFDSADHYLKVTFTVPPSNRVKIVAHLPHIANPDGSFYLGLATDTSATSLGAKYESLVWDVDETDDVIIHREWYINGADHSWSANQSKTLYVIAKETSTGSRIFMGGAFGAWQMEAIALPNSIGDGT